MLQQLRRALDLHNAARLRLFSIPSQENPQDRPKRAVLELLLAEVLAKTIGSMSKPSRAQELRTKRNVLGQTSCLPALVTKLLEVLGLSPKETPQSRPQRLKRHIFGVFGSLPEAVTRGPQIIE